MQIHLRFSLLKRANNIPKLPGEDCVAKNWALATMLKALPLVHFWSVLLLKEQIMISVRKTLKTLVWSAQNRLISSEICLENNHKIGRFLPITFWWSLPRKLPRNYLEIERFFPEFIPKNSAKFDFFSATCQKPCLGHQAISYSHIVDDLSFLFCEMKAIVENVQIWEEEG